MEIPFLPFLSEIKTSAVFSELEISFVNKWMERIIKKYDERGLLIKAAERETALFVFVVSFPPPHRMTKDNWVRIGRLLFCLEVAITFDDVRVYVIF